MMAEKSGGMMKIFCEKPAVKWGEALPIGNGHTGGMVYSGTQEDRIDLSENTFFSGKKSLENNRRDAHKAFYHMRAQLMKNDFDGAQHSCEEFIGHRRNYGTNLPVGALSIKYGHEFPKVESYGRNLDILDGVIESDYLYENCTFRRTVFASHPHKVLAYRVCSDKAGSIHLTAGFEGAGASCKVAAAGSGLDFIVKAHENMHSDGKTGVKLCGHIAVVTDGHVEISDKIHVSDASEVIFFIGMSTNFKNRKKSEIILENLRAHVTRSGSDGWEAIYTRHVQDINRCMGRVDLQIQSKYRTGKANTCIPLMFQYGRYLLLSSSREDSKLPAHLQGIWNDNVACRIGWTCDMHLDINTQMNYWPSEVTNLPETAEPLFRWIEEELVPSGRITARESYALDGWAAEIVSNSWGFTAPYWAPPISPCPTGGVWILTHMWEHYLTSRDENFLRYRAYSVIREAAAFFADYVFEDPLTGVLTSGPSVSPENAFSVNGKDYHSSNGCTYEILMIRELFSIFLQSSRILGIEDDLVSKAANAITRLLPYKIQSDGKIAEWSHKFGSSDLQHRHTSHLLGLFPFAQITPEKTPELAEAAAVSIQEKLDPSESWEDTGWARSLMTLYAARLHDGEAAYKHIESMLEHLHQENFMVIHPPTRGAGAFDNVYELDGNTGLTSAIAEMLVQSHDGVLQLLPALPDSWESGRITGLIARGGIAVDLYWAGGMLTRAEFSSQKDMNCTISYKGNKALMICKNKEKVVFTP